MNEKNLRVKHIEFIEKDTQNRGEIITSHITYFGAIYSLKVKKEGSKIGKTIVYSAAQSVMSGYRAINL